SVPLGWHNAQPEVRVLFTARSARAVTKAPIVLRALVIATGCLHFAGVAHGGLYLPAEPSLRPTNNTQLFLNVLNELRGLRNAQNPLRRQFLTRVAELEAKDRQGVLTVEDRVNLSGYHIRLEEFEKAVAVLDPVAGAGPANFMVRANLAPADE